MDDEAKIPSDVIDAGVLLLYEYDPQFGNERDIVEMIMRLGKEGNEG